MVNLSLTFAAALSASAAAADLEQAIPDGTVYMSNDPRSQQMHDRVNSLPEDATHIAVPEKEYHDKLGERKWITENQFMRALAYLGYLGYDTGPIEYSHSAVDNFRKILNQFVEDRVTTDMKPEDYKGDIYAQYDMLRVEALENQDFVDHALKETKAYQDLEDKTQFQGNVRVLDGYLGLMGHDFDVGTSNDGRRIQAIQEFQEARKALDFLKTEEWDKTQNLTQGQQELIEGGLALLGFGADPEEALAAFYEANGIEVDPPVYNLEALAYVHENITKDGQAFDRVEEILYDFDTVEEKISYAQAALTFYGEHTELDDQRWAHTMLNVAQLGRRMGDAIEDVQEPTRIFADTSHIFWDITRWNYDNAAGKIALPDISDVLENGEPRETQALPEKGTLLESEHMRWSSLTDGQKEQFEDRFIAIPLSRYENLIPEDLLDRRYTEAGRDEIYRLLGQRNGQGHFAIPELQETVDMLNELYTEQLRDKIDPNDPHYAEMAKDPRYAQALGDLSPESILAFEVGRTRDLAFEQIMNRAFFHNGNEDFHNDETTTMFIYLQDRSGSFNAQKLSGNSYLKNEPFRPEVKPVNMREYLNNREISHDPNSPIPYEQEQQETALAQAVQQTPDANAITAAQTERQVTQQSAFTVGT